MGAEAVLDMVEIMEPEPDFDGEESEDDGDNTDIL